MMEVCVCISVQVLATMSAKKKTQLTDSPAHRDIATEAGTPYNMRDTGCQLTMEMCDGGSGGCAGGGSSGSKPGIASAGRSGSGGGYGMGAAQRERNSGGSPISPLEGPVRRLYGDDDDDDDEFAESTCTGSFMDSQNTTLDDCNDTSSNLSGQRGPGTRVDSPQTVRRKRTLVDALVVDEGLGDGGGDETHKRLNTSTMSGISSLDNDVSMTPQGSVSTPCITRHRATASDSRYAVQGDMVQFIGVTAIGDMECNPIRASHLTSVYLPFCVFVTIVT